MSGARPASGDAAKGLLWGAGGDTRAVSEEGSDARAPARVLHAAKRGIHRRCGHDKGGQVGTCGAGPCKDGQRVEGTIAHALRVHGGRDCPCAANENRSAARVECPQ